MLSSPSNLNNKKVFDLIYDDYQFAKVLSSFGIDFYNHYDDNLSDLCLSKGISSDKLFGYRNSLQESFAFDKDTLRKECIASTSKLGILESNVEILSFENKNFNAHRREIFDTLESIKERINCGVIFLASIFSALEIFLTIIFDRPCLK